MVDQESVAESTPTPAGPGATARAFLDLVEPGDRAPWALALGFALLAAIVEMIGAGVVFGIAGMFTADLDPTTLPVVGTFIGRLGSGSAGRELLVVAVLAAAFYTFRGAVVLSETYYRARVAEEAGRQLAGRLFRGYLTLPYPFFLQRNTAGLIRTAFSSVRLVVVNFMTPALRLMSDGLIAAGLIGILLVAAPWATAIAIIALVPAVYILLRWVRPKLLRLSERSETETATSLQILQQGLQGVREIKVTQTGPYFAELFDRSQSRLARIKYRFVLGREAPRVAIETLIFGLIVLLLVAGSVGPLAKTQSLAVLGLFAYAALRVMPIANRTTVNVNKMRFGSAAVESVRKDLRLLGAAAAAGPEQEPGLALESAIELRDVGFTYEGSTAPALSDINLVIKKGETIGIAGQTGSGKSTLLDLILGLLSPTTGEVLVDGEPIQPARWLRSIGMVPQSVFLIDDTIRRNIAFGVADDAIDDDRVERALDLAQLGSVVDELPAGAETLVGERGVRLSGGQRQRIAIARALYNDPAILILDEGTSALDSTTESELMEALQSAARGRTVIIVAHRLSTIRRADRIVYLDAGTVADIGRFEELVSRSATFRGLAQ